MSAVPSVTAAQHASLEARLARFPAQQVELASQRVLSYREAASAGTDALPLVLLHGIGSGAASWVQQFEVTGREPSRAGVGCAGLWRIDAGRRCSRPWLSHYAAVLKDWLDALGIERCVLVGHSLGAIIAGAFAAANPQRVAGLLLLSPAGGYGAASAEVRETKRDQRLAMLNELGPQGLAEQRSTNMLSANAERRSPRVGALEHVARDPARLRAGDASARQRRSRQRPRALQRPHQRGSRRGRHHHASRRLRAHRAGRRHRNCRSCRARGTPVISKHPPRTPRSSTRSAARAADHGANE